MTVPAGTADRASDPDRFRRVLGQYPTGVTIVTALGADGTPLGMAVGSFTSVSLDPPLVAFLPSASSSRWQRMSTASSFCVNVLAADQEHVCRAFASKSTDPFGGLAWHPASSGAPILDDAVAWVDCDARAVHEAGDHRIVVGRVRDLAVARPALPLLFFQGGYGRFSPHSFAASDSRFAAQLRLVDRARPLMEATATRTNGLVVASYCDGMELTLLASAGEPADLRLRAAIGERLPVRAPLGVWWAAWARDAQAQAWLATVADDQLRAVYVTALHQIRRHGYCLGLADVQSGVGAILDGRAAAGPRSAEQEEAPSMTHNPLLHVPDDSADDAPGGQVVSLWAPCFTPGGEVALGLMLTAAPRHDRPLRAYVPDLLELAARVTALHE